MKAPGRAPIVMEQSARQALFGVCFLLLLLLLLTLLHSLQIFPALRALLSTPFQSKLCKSNSSLKKKVPGKTQMSHFFKQTLYENTIQKPSAL